MSNAKIIGIHPTGTTAAIGRTGRALAVGDILADGNEVVLTIPASASSSSAVQVSAPVRLTVTHRRAAPAEVAMPATLRPVAIASGWSPAPRIDV